MSRYHAIAFHGSTAGVVVMSGPNEEAYRVARKYKAANPDANVIVAHEENVVEDRDYEREAAQKPEQPEQVRKK